MANLTDSTNLAGTVTLTKASGTKVTLDTDKKYLTKDIELTVNATTASPTFTGGNLSGTATATGNSCSISDTTNNSGVSITTACTATRANVTYNGAVSGWVDKSNGAVAYSSGSSTLTAKTYYINTATLTAPSANSRKFSIISPGGTSNIHTYEFNVDTNSRTTIKLDSTLTMQWNDTTKALDFIYT